MIKNISNLGDASIYCDFGDEINKEINTKVISYFKSIRKLKIEGVPNVIGKDRTTIKFNVRQKKAIVEAIAFRMIGEYEKLISGKPLDIVYNISENYWNGKTSLQLEIKGIKYSDE